MWDESSFQALLQSNDKPPDSMIPAIHQRLVGPAAELVLIDREIEDLNQKLQNVKNEYEKIESSISQLKRIIAPLRLLPDDILREIFFQASLTSCSNAIRSRFVSERPYPGPDQHDQPPLLLLRICRRWRDIALTTPQIWSRLAFVLPAAWPPIADGVNHPSIHVQRVQIARSLRCIRDDGLPNAVNIWINRSGATPLSISIPRLNSTVDSHAAESHPEILRGVKQLFKVLGNHADRWQRLQLQINAPDFLLFSEHFAAHQLRNLEHVDFTHVFSWTDETTLMHLLSSPLFTDIPSLRSLVWTSLEGTKLPRPYRTHIWNNLTDVHIVEYADIPNAVYILERPSLVNCNITVSDSGVTPGPPSRRLIMPRIRDLSLTLSVFGTDRGVDTTNLDAPVYHISAPFLQKLKYDTEGEPFSSRRFGQFLKDSFPAFPLGSILEEAPNLTELELITSATAMDVVKQALLLPKLAIEHSVIGSKRVVVAVNQFNEAVTTSDMALQQLFSFPEWCLLTLQSTDAEFLKIAQMKCEELNQALDSCMCPQLKYLEVFGLDTVTDEFIFSLIAYRLWVYKHAISRHETQVQQIVEPAGGPTMNPLTPLRLKFHFLKKQGQIIPEQVERFAEFLDMKNMYRLALSF